MADKSRLRTPVPVVKWPYGLYWLTTMSWAVELAALMAEIILEKFVANVESAVFAAVEFGKSGILLAANLNIATCGISERVPASDAFTSSAVIDVSEFCLLYSSARYAYSAFIRSLPPMVMVIRSAFFSVSAFASLLTTSSRSVEVAPSLAKLLFSVYPSCSAICSAKLCASSSPYPVVMLSPRAT